MAFAKERFPADYTSAQHRFREAVQHAGGRLDSLALEAKGPRGDRLAIDLAWFGVEQPRRVFVHSSGLHGVEAFAGSAIQSQWLEYGVPRPPDDGAIILIHVLNPYGMAWLRRFNENNVDLNRNFLASDEEFAGAPEGYWRLNAFLNPIRPPSRNLFYLRAGLLVLRHGLSALRQAVAGGQYVNPMGLFFGGSQLEDGPAKLQQYLADRLAGVERIVAIDVHTGLGRFGDDRLLVDAKPERAEVNREMRSAFGERVQVLDADLSVAYEVRGAQHSMYYRLFPSASVYFASQEFGTYNPLAVVEALRAENRWHHYGAGTPDYPAKARLFEVFCPKSERWRQAVLRRGAEVIQQALVLAFHASDTRGSL